jgi:hypothetical protein
MLNLLVASNPTAWETDQLMRMEAARFKEYSDGSEAKAIHRTRPETLKLLDGTPALLMYENGSEAEHKDTVRYGLLRDVTFAGADITFRFEQEGCFPRTVVQEFGDRLSIHAFEYNRTHWAIKDGALLSAMLAKLQRSYDIVLSFAGEDRKYVHAVAKHLRANGVKVFYDTFEQAALWGKDLAEHLDSVYQRAGQYCVIFISKFYAEKMWTKHERRSALARALREQKEYILPARFDDTELEGIRHTTAYISASDKTPAQLSKLLLEKLGRPAAPTRRRKKSTTEA